MKQPTLPALDVFISYSAKDKHHADGVCAVLEGHRIRCWIAPRDITPGTEWGAAIIGGIDASKVMVLVFSSHANESPQVRREVERAISKGLAILPFRIEDVKPAGAMEYALNNTHWLDAFTPPIERQMEFLAESVKKLLTCGESTTTRAKASLAFKIGIAKLSLADSKRSGVARHMLIQLCSSFDVKVSFDESSIEAYHGTIDRVAATILSRDGAWVAEHLVLSVNSINLLTELIQGNKPSIEEHLALMKRLRLPEALTSAFQVTWTESEPNLQGANKIIQWLNDVDQHLEKAAAA